MEASSIAAPPGNSAREGASVVRLGDKLLRWAGISALVGLAGLTAALGWLEYLGRPYSAGSNLGYNLGLAGGIAMATLLIYPLRKRLGSWQRLGEMRLWFHYHVIVGVSAPILIGFHSTFHMGSMNGRVAFYAMIAVVISGIVGRFAYRRVHYGLNDTLLTLADAERLLSESTTAVRQKLADYPEFSQHLEGFRKIAFAPSGMGIIGLWKFLSLRWRGRIIARRVRDALRKSLRASVAAGELAAPQAKLTYKLASQQIQGYVAAVCDAAQLQGWERVLSLWNLIHIPVIYLLAFSAIVHVVAVHAY